MTEEVVKIEHYDISFPKMGKRHVRVVLDMLSDTIIGEAIYRGLEDLLKVGLDKVKTAGLEGAELTAKHDEAVKVVEENLKAVLAGEVKLKSAPGKGKAAKIPAKIRQEAERLAIEVLHDEIRREGGKPSHYNKSDIRKWAKDLIVADASYITKAEENIKAREEAPKLIPISLAGLKPNAAKVEAEKTKKANGKKGSPISAKQASMPAVRTKKPAEHATSH